jgi:plasmid stability protein
MATLTLYDLPEEVVSRLEQRARAHGRSLNSEVVDCLSRQSAANTDTENWLQQVEALRAELKGGLIPVDELVAATERDSH